MSDEIERWLPFIGTCAILIVPALLAKAWLVAGFWIVGASLMLLAVRMGYFPK